MSHRVVLPRLNIAEIAFGDYLVLVSQRLLLRKGIQVQLGDREFELLLTLIDGYGTFISKDELLARVWPGRVVDENTLEGRVSMLRRALGADRSVIKTIAGRGYQFVAALRNVNAPEIDALPRTFALLPPPVAAASVGNPLPSSVSQLIGRAIALDEITELAHSNRLITLVGTGGIGKTRLAIEAARRLVPVFRDGVFLAELGSVSTGDFVPTTVGAALGYPPGDGKAVLERIASLIFSKRLLLVLDNCEHLIGAAAQLVEHLLRASPEISIIATSREALRIDGEYVYRVSSLDVPEADVESFDVITASGALQLFQARQSQGAAHALTPEGLELQVRICRRLDGIPLALELAAARVAVVGLQGVADRLDDRFRLLTNGARTALPRQQTLRATLDWSFELLQCDEKEVLTQLSIFAGNFTLTSALAVISTAERSSDVVAECIASLVDKSLLSLSQECGSPRYRLLETTRVYAREKLLATGSAERFALAHARYHMKLFEDREHEAQRGGNAEWRSAYIEHLEDFRAAVDWSFGLSGDPDIGVRLTLAGVPLSLQLGLLTECITRIDMALGWLNRRSTGSDLFRMKLNAALGTGLLYRTFAREEGTVEAFKQTLDIADRLGDIDYQKYAVWGYWCCAYLNGQYAAALEMATRFHTLALSSEQPWDALVGSRMVGVTHLCLGHLADSQVALERMLAVHPQTASRTHRIRFLYDEKMHAHASLAHALYLQGFQDKAMRMALSAKADAMELGHVPSICYALSEGVSAMALLNGDADALAEAVSLLESTTRRHGVSTWKARSRIWTALAPLQQGHLDAYHKVIVPSLAEMGLACFYITGTPLLMAIAAALGKHGHVDDGIALATRAIERAQASGDACSFVECTRMQARLILLRDGEPSEAHVENQWILAMQSAHQNGFLSWELRCALDLTNLWLRREKPDATALLRSVRDRFTEGWTNTDLQSASEILAQARFSWPSAAFKR